MATFRLRGMAPKTSPHLSDLQGLWAFVNKDDANKEDIVVLGSQIEFTDRKTLALPTSEGTKEYGFNDWSFAQLSDLLKIPSGYLETCPVTGKGGMKDQIEARMQSRLTREHLIRVRNTETEDGLAGMVRSVLPGTYAIFDNRHLLQSVEKAIGRVGNNFELQLHNAGDPKSIDRSFHMRMIRKEQFSVIDDPHRMGFHCRTSEVGGSDIRLDALVYRLVCKNGMMGWADSEVLRVKHKNFQRHEVVPQLQEGVHASLRQEAAIQDMLERKYSEEVSNPETEVMFMAARMRLGDGIRDQALAVLRSTGGDATRFTLMQAFTQAAQQFSLVERLKIEEAVGKYTFGKGTIMAQAVDA